MTKFLDKVIFFGPAKAPKETKPNCKHEQATQFRDWAWCRECGSVIRKHKGK